MTLKDKLRKAGIVGTISLASLVGTSYLSGCEEKPVPAQNQVQKVEEKKEEKQYTANDLVDTIKIKLADSEPFELEHQGNGVYRGRQNKLVGSEIVEIKYDFNRKKTYASVEIEGSLFSPKKRYSSSFEFLLGSGIYSLEGEKCNGKDKRIGLTIRKDFKGDESFFWNFVDSFSPI